MKRRRLTWVSAWWCALVFAQASGIAQDATPAPSVGKVQIQFVPPPMEGTISLGVYDAKGKLVRVVKREARTEDFTVALNGLITFWDGNDSAGNPAAPGGYSARGFLVGELERKREAIRGNDWITDETSPRVAAVRDLRVEGENLILLFAKTDGKTAAFRWNASTQKLDGEATWTETEAAPKAQGPTKSAGRDGSTWVIDRREVKQYGRDGEALRSVPIEKRQPQPVRIAASETADEIYLLEEDERMQRVRGLRIKAAPAGGPPLASTEELFTRTIWVSDKPGAAREFSKLPNGKTFTPQDSVTVALRENPLEQDKPGKAELAVGIDGRGSFLRLADGLPLAQISDTKNLKWAALAKGTDEKQLVVFQSDGAAVEEYHVGNISDMMSFDGGEFTWPPDAEAPSPDR